MGFLDKLKSVKNTHSQVVVLKSIYQPLQVKSFSVMSMKSP